MVNFYDSYSAYKEYSTPRLNDKIKRQFDREFWESTSCDPNASVLEIGCGTGLFLSYLAEKGVTNFFGIDADVALQEFIPSEVQKHFKVLDILDESAWTELGQKFDVVVLFDVLEHFEPEDAFKLLSSIKEKLNPGGKIIVRLPNASSPWGLNYQYGDLTHKAAYNPLSIRQLAVACGLKCDKVFEQISGSRKRRILDRLLHKFLSAILMSPPEIWSANFLSILSLAEED